MIRAPDDPDYPFSDPPAPGDAVTVAPGILWLPLPLPMALDHVNSHALNAATAGR